MTGYCATRWRRCEAAIRSANQTSIIQLTSDCGAYLPTERAVKGGGYSARIDDGVVGPEGGRVLVEKTSRLLLEMWPAPK